LSLLLRSRLNQTARNSVGTPALTAKQLSPEK
jgi:hypothetical protein